MPQRLSSAAVSTPSDDALLFPFEGGSATVAGRLYSRYPDLVCLLGLDGRVQQANPAMARATGLAEEKLRGVQLVTLLHGPEAASVERVLATFALQPKEAVTQDVSAALLSPSGAPVWYAWTFVGSSDGEAVLAVGRDISAFKTTEAQLRQREEQLERSLAVAGLATWEVDLASLTIALDKRMQALLGIEPGELEDNRLPVDAFIETYTEGKGASTFFLAMLRLARSTAPEYQEQVAIALRSRSGSVTPVWFQLQGMLGNDQRVDAAFGTVLRQQPALAAPAASADTPVPDNAALGRILAAGKLATFRIDPDELTVTTSASFNSWLGYPAGHPLTWATLAQDHLGQTAALAFTQALSSIASGEFEARILHLALRGGRGQTLEASCVLQKVPGPTPVVEAVLQDVTDWHLQKRLLEAQAEDAVELVEASGVLRMRISETDVQLDSDTEALLGVAPEELEDGRLPLAAFAERLEGGMDTLLAAFAALQAGAPYGEALWQLTTTSPPRSLFVRLWPASEEALYAAVVPLPEGMLVGNASVPENQPAVAASAPADGLLQALLASMPGQELPEQIVALCRQVERQHAGLSVQLWLMDPSGLGSYQVYPTGQVATDAPGFATFTERLKQGLPLASATYVAPAVPHGHGGAWEAYPLLRDDLLVGYVWVSAENQAAFSGAQWALLALALRVGALLDREALRESAVLQAEVDSERGALGTELETARAEVAQLKTALAQLERAFADALPAAVAGRLQGPLNQELPVTVERLTTTHRELESELGRLLSELPTLLRRLPETEGQLAWELLRKALTRRKTQTAAPAELFPQLEIELTGLGVAKASETAEALAQLGWHEGLGSYLQLVKHPDAPVLLAKMAEFHTLRTALARTEQLTERLAERTRTLAVLQQVPTASDAAPAHVNLDELIESLLPVFAPLYQTGLRLERVYEARPVVHAQPGLVGLLCLQLLEGRLRRLPSESHARLVVRLEAGMAVIQLADQGPVVPLELQQQLSLDATAERPPAALVPLRQAAQLARRLGGAFRVTSSREQTTITVSLPMASGGPPDA